MRTVSKTFVCVLVDDRSEVLFLAKRVSSGLLALVSRAMVTILKVLLFLELKGFYLLLVADYILKLNNSQPT